MSNSHQQAKTSPGVGEHLIHGFFPLTFSEVGNESKPEAMLNVWTTSVLGLHVADISKRLSWEPDDANTLQQPAWALMKVDKGLVLKDFYPHVRQILGKGHGEPFLCQSFVLNTPVLSRFKGNNNRLQKRLLEINLRQAAAKRCGLASLCACIDGARLFSFRTGVAILELFWYYEVDGELSFGTVLEGNYFLSHDNHSQSNKPETQLHQLNSQNLRTIAQALLPDLPGKRCFLHPDRRILYSAVKLNQDVDDETLQALATWLSQRQTTDYQPSLETHRDSIWQPFRSLCHASALDGGASVIFDARQVSGFVQSFVRGTNHNLYIPLFVTSLHNHFWLINQTEWIPTRRGQAGSRAETENLEHLYEQTVEFRRYFYFPIVSQITLHNTFYKRWQDTLRISERLHFVEQTARDVAELIKTRRIRWLRRISGAAGGFLLTHELLEFLSASGLPGSIPNMRLWFVKYFSAAPEVREHMMEIVEHWEIGIFLGSLIGALLGLWISWNFGTQSNHE